MSETDHVIRVHLAGKPRWIASIARQAEDGCTVTWDIARARRFTGAAAAKYAELLQHRMATGGATFSAEPTPGAGVCTAPHPDERAAGASL